MAIPPFPRECKWHVILTVEPDTPTDQVRARYRTARSLFHPDRGGDADAFAAIQSAWAAFCRERGIPEN